MKLNRNRITEFGGFLVCAVAGFSIAVPAVAQEQDDPLLEEIVVTSKARGTVKLMDEPTAITVSWPQTSKRPASRI